jgi:hypothetical protein
MRRGSGSRLVLAPLASLVVACTGGGAPDNTSDAGSTSSSASSTSSSGTSGTSSSGGTTSSSGTSGGTGACGEPADVSLEGVGSGKGVIRGKITLSEPVAQIQILVGRIGGYTIANATASSQGGGPRSVFTFEAHKLGTADSGFDAGDYYVHALVDKDGSGTFGDGDWGGFYPGTSATPLGPWQATKIQLRDGSPSKCDVDFGIGPLVCHVSWGNPCTSDDECRPTICECNNLSASTRRTGACEPGPKTCRRAPNTDCTTICGASGVKSDRQSNCLGK